MMAAMNTLRIVLGCLMTFVDQCRERWVRGQIRVLREYSGPND